MDTASAAGSARTIPKTPPAPLTRRALLQLGAAALFAPAAAAFASMVERLDLGRPDRTIRIGPHLTRPVTFAGDALAVPESGGRVAVLSARCTHLGCRIRRLEGDQLVCPCHGSRFHLDGSVACGPAARSLAHLPYRVDGKSGALLVVLS